MAMMTPAIAAVSGLSWSLGFFMVGNDRQLADGVKRGAFAGERLVGMLRYRHGHRRPKRMVLRDAVADNALELGTVNENARAQILCFLDPNFTSVHSVLPDGH